MNGYAPGCARVRLPVTRSRTTRDGRVAVSSIAYKIEYQFLVLPRVPVRGQSCIKYAVVRILEQAGRARPRGDGPGVDCGHYHRQGRGRSHPSKRRTRGSDPTSQLSDEDLARAGMIGDGEWSVKDVAGHTDGWYEPILEDLSGWRPRGLPKALALLFGGEARIELVVSLPASEDAAGDPVGHSLEEIACLQLLEHRLEGLSRHRLLSEIPHLALVA
jgi:hypothetical protein